MADTKRSLTALQALLADNTSGDISPQDVRDFLVTALGTAGAITWLDNSTAQSLTVAGGVTKIINAAADILSGGVTADFTNSKLTCPIAGVYIILFAFSASSSVANVLTSTSVFVNGVEQEHSTIERLISSGGDIGAFAGFAFTSVGAGEDIDIRMLVDKNTNITITQGQFGALLFG
jgi:hypothetical protein